MKVYDKDTGNEVWCCTVQKHMDLEEREYKKTCGLGEEWRNSAAGQNIRQMKHWKRLEKKDP